MEGKTQQSSEYAVIRRLRRFREKYFSNAGELEDDLTPVADTDAEDMPCFLDILPVNVQFLVMTLLSPPDICRLGATSHYWRDVVRDPLLWRYFLQRDMPHWSSIDHVSMPQLQALAGPLCSENDQINLDEVEDGDQGKEPKHDYMAEYLKGCPAHRQRWRPLRPPYEAVTSFLQSLVPSSEPRYAMFGPGMEQLDVSLVTRLMHSPDHRLRMLSMHILPVTDQWRQINGVGSGISFMYNNQHKLNILTLYSTTRAERERARVEQRYVSNKLFTHGGMDQSGCPVFSPIPQVQEVCQVVDGFIYVANAEPGRGEGELEGAQIQTVLSPAWGLTSRPLLVLSCVSREERDTVMATSLGSTSTSTGPRAGWRTPCVEVAHRLGLPQLPNPWMVQDIVAESLSGLLDGVSWLLKCSGVRLQQLAD